MESRICPYLCLIDDPNTSADFPFENNACYRAKKPFQVALDYQASYCLDEGYIECLGYINGWNKKIPSSIRAYQPAAGRLLRNKWTWIGIITVILLSLGFIFYQDLFLLVKYLF